jgi:hypothetical protein
MDCICFFQAYFIIAYIAIIGDRIAKMFTILFDRLEISREKELCDQFMGRFPVISITSKGAAGERFPKAKSMLRRIIGKESQRFQFLMQSDILTAADHDQYEALVTMDKVLLC